MHSKRVYPWSQLGGLEAHERGTIKATVLIETLPAVFERSEEHTSELQSPA